MSEPTLRDAVELIAAKNAEVARLQRSLYVAEQGWSTEQSRIAAAAEAMRAKCEEIAREYARTAIGDEEQEAAENITVRIAALKGNGEGR